MAEFRMPSLGADMDEGKLVEWLVKVGDRVERGDLVAVVETSKAAVEIEIFTSGVIAELCAEPGDVVAVGGVLARLEGQEGETPPEAPAEAPAPAPAAEATAPLPAAAPVRAAAPPPPGGRIRISPAARKRARELGVDASSLRGTGHGGAVSLSDVEAAAAGTAVKPGRASAMRGTIAAAMARSKREIPHYYLSQTVDVAAALAWLQETNGARKITERLLPAALFLKAVAKSALAVPGLNGTWEGGGYRPAESVHLGVAVSLREGGLVAPTLRDAHTLELGALMSALRDLVNRTRAGTLRSSELGGGTLTVTNLGDQGVEAVFGVINPPQVALVGLGTVREEARVVEGAIVVRPVVTLTLSADHRASDGLQGARFLAAVDKALQRPEAL